MPLNPFDEAARGLPQTTPTPVPPARPRPPNPFDQYAGPEVEDPMTALMRAQRQKSQEQNRESRIKAQQIGKTLGVPPAWIDDQDVPRLEKEAQDRLVPYSAITAKSPGLASWLAERPDAATLSRGDLPHLGAIEWLVTMPLKAWDINMHQRRASILRTESIIRNLTEPEKQEMAWRENILATDNDLDIGGSWWRGVIAGGAGLLPNIGFGMANAAKRGAQGFGAGAALGGAAGAAATAWSGPGALGGAGAAALGVGTISAGLTARFGYAEDTFYVEAGGALKEYSEIKDEFGRKIDPDAAKAAAVFAGVLNAGAEVVAAGIFLKAFKKAAPGMADKVAKYGARQAVKEALKNRTTRAAFAHGFRTWMEVQAKESGIEGLQRLFTITAGELGKLATEGGVTPRGAVDIADDVLAETAAAFQSMTLISALPGATQTVRGVREAQKAPAVTEFFKTFGDLTAASSTFKDAPDEAADFLKRAAGRSIPTVYAPTELWEEYWQKKDIDPAELADELLGEQDALENAKSNGTDLEIPIETYATKIAPTEHNAGLADILRIAPREMNGREAAALAEAREAVGRAENLEPTPGAEAPAAAPGAPSEAPSAAEGAPAPAATPEQQIQRITTELTQRFVLTQRFTPKDAAANARLAATAIGRLAVDMGQPPEEVFRRYGLGVRSTIDPRIEAKAKARPAAAPAEGPSAEPRIGDQLAAATTPEQRVAMMGLERTPNARVQEFAAELQAATPGLERLGIAINPDNTLYLETFQVAPEEQGKGIGTAVMEKVVAFADREGLTVSLTPARAGAPGGTTSAARLRAFYKRFGFVENTGAAKDPAVAAKMYRRPAVQQQEERAAAEQVEAAIFNVLDPQELERELSESLGEERAARLMAAYEQATGDMTDEARVSAALDLPRISLEEWVASEQAELFSTDPTWDNLLRDAREALGLVPQEEAAPTDPDVELSQAAKKKAKPARKLNLYNLLVAPARFVNGVLRVSTRVPDGPNAAPATEPLATTLDVLYTAPARSEAPARFAGYLKDFDLLTDAEKQLEDPQAVIEAFVTRGVGNLRWLWDLFGKEGDDIRERAKQWYRGGRVLSERLAARHNLSLHQAAAVFAVLSPQKDWFQNVNLGFRVADIFALAEETNPEFDKDYYKRFARRTRDAKGSATRGSDAHLERTIKYVRDNYLGKTWSELDLGGKAILLREIDEDNNPRAYRVVTPEGGFGEIATTQAPGRPPAGVGWGTYKHIGNAIAILQDGSVLNVHARLGGKHKVRSFFNNLIDPDNATAVTIDTHAAGAVVLQPVVGDSPVVKRTLSHPPGVVNLGLSGLNVIMAESYFRLAQELSTPGRPVLAREVQSVTWEAIRLMFPSDEKDEALWNAVQGIWKDHGSGKIDIHAARSRILEASGRKGQVGRPAWADAGPGLAPNQGGLPDGQHYGAGATLPARRGAALGDPGGAGGPGAADRGAVLGGLGYDPATGELGAGPGGRGGAGAAAADALDFLAEAELEELDQPLPGEPLVITHNTTERKLRAALKLGGLAMPSLAIVPANRSITGFGDITLLGDRSLADPSLGAQVFGADIYSPRHPRVSYKISKAGRKLLDKLITKWHAVSGDRTFGDDIESEGPRGLETINALHYEFLEQRGVPAPEPEMVQATARTGARVDHYSTGRALEATIAAAGLEQEWRQYLEATWDSLEVTERIGSPRPKPHTLANVVREMKKNLRGGESTSNLHGIGQLRAHFTPKFRSLAAVKKAAGRLVDEEAFEEIKDEVEAEFFEIVGNLGAYYAHDHRSMRFTDTVLAVMEDAPRIGLSAALSSYEFAGVPVDIQTKIGDYLTKLKDLPTEYFEVKHARAVDLSEFRAAVVPPDTSPDIRQALERAGVPVVEYLTGQRLDTVEAVAADLELHFQEQKAGTEARRGSMQRDPRTGQIRINLFTEADPSTALHELGHVFLRILHDLAQQALAIPEAERTPGQIRTLVTYNKALAALRVSNFTEVTEAHHERWATHFEDYLRTGKAPSPALRDLFITFRRWLTRVYADYIHQGGAVSPQLRQVFDRLLATDAEIREAEADANVVPLFATEKEMGTTPARFAAYRSVVADAHNKAVETLDAQLQQEVAREETLAWQTQRAAVQQQVTDEVHTRPVYRALSGIRRGTTPGGASLVPGEPPVPSRIDRQTAVALYGKDRVAALPAFLTTTKGDGVHPDQLAEMFGFTGGDQLVTALTDAPPMQEVIEEETDRRMLAEHGSMLLSNELGEAAEAAVANETRQLVVEAELRALAAKKREVQPFTAQARREEKVKTDQAKAERDQLAAEIRAARDERRTATARMRGAIPSRAAVLAAVRGQLAVTRVGKLRPDRYWAAMQKASRLAIESANRGDWATATHQKTLELVNIVLYREAVTAKQEVAKRERAVKQLERTAAQKVIGLAGGNFLAQINGFVSRYGLASIAPQTLEGRPAIGPWLAARKGEGDPVEELSPMAQDDTTRMDYRELTLEQFMNLTDDIAQLASWARRQTKFAKLFDQADLLVIRDRLIAQAQQVVQPANEDIKFFRDDDKARREAGLKYARKLKLGAIARILDGGQDDGIFWNTFVRPFNVADDEKRTRKLEAYTEFRRLLTLLPRGFLSLKDEMHVEGVGSMPREARLAVAMNWGTKTNRDRLLNDPVRKYSQQQYELILDTLDEAEWAYVNGTIAYVNSFWLEIAALQERVTGLKPEKVEAEPFMTKFGEMPGGYYPIAYDPRLGTPAQMHETAQALEQMKKGAYLSATTKQGHNQPRVKHYRGAMKLEINVAWTHVDQVIHDLTHREVFLDINRLLRDQSLDQALRTAIGTPMKEQIADTVAAIALGDGESHTGEEALAWMRQGAQLSALGLNFWTMVQQPSGLFNGAQRVGPKWVALGMWKWFSSPTQLLETVRWVNAKSAVMRDRAVAGSQDTMQLRQDFEQAGGRFDTVVRTVTKDEFNQRLLLEMYLWHIQLGQRLADVPTWLGAYERYMADPQEDRSDEAHELRAIHLADQVVIDSQGSGSIKDLSAVQRTGPAMKSWLMFFSYGNTTWNSWEVAKQTNARKSPSDIGKLVADYAAIYALPAAWVVLAGNAFGKFDDDTWEEWFGHMAAETIGGAMNGFILMRNLSSVAKGYVYGDPGRYEGPMASRIFSSTERFLTQSVQLEADLAWWISLNDLTGVSTGGLWPSTLTRNAVRGWVALEEGRTRNPFVLLVGPPPREN